MRGKLKRTLSNVLTAAMFLSLLPANPLTVKAANINPGQSTGPRSVAVSGNVFLGNDNLELGINQYGTFGSTAQAPSNFHPWSGASNCIGMRTYDTDAKTWDNAVDFFLPGTVDEGFLFAWSSSSEESPTQQALARSNARSSATSENYTGYSTTDESTENELKAVTTATVNNTLSYKQTVSFAKDVGVAGVKIELTNTSDNNLYNLQYFRAFDPDQSGSYTTNNYHYVDSDGTVWVIASTNSTPVGTISFDDFTAAATYPYIFMVPPSNDYTAAPVWQKVGWSSYSHFAEVTSSSDTYQLGKAVYDDKGIGIRFDVPELDAHDSITLIYNMSLDSDIKNALSQLTGGNLALQPESYVVNTGDTVELSVDMATLFSDAPEGTTYSYQWYGCATEEGTYNPIDGATGETYTAPTATAGTNYYKCIVTPSTASSVTTGLARVTVLEATATTYEVKFNANTSDTITNMPGTQTVKSDDKVLEPKSLVREGYTLEGWYTESACTNKWNFNASPTSNMTLFAKWISIPTPTVNLKDGKISVTHGNASSGETMSTYTLEYSPDNGGNWYLYASDADGMAIDFTKFSADGYHENTATLLFRQTSTIDGVANIKGTTSAITLYKVNHSITTSDSENGNVELGVSGDGATSATEINSMGNAYAAGAMLTYTATPGNSNATSYFAGINGNKNFTGLNGDFIPAAGGKYVGGTYTFASLADSQSSAFYFGNWKKELEDTFADDTNSKAEDLKAAIGESGSAQRELFTALFPDVDLTVYDNLSDKDQVLTQYIGRDSTDTADEIVGDLTNRNADDSKSALENFAETQSQLEGNPTYPEVSIDPTDSIAMVTPPASVTNPTIVVKDSNGNEISPTYLTSYDLDGKIPDAPNNYITVQVTDSTVNYNVVVRAYVNVSTYKIEENSASLNPSVGGTLSINSDNTGSSERTLDNETPQSEEVYTVQRIQWKGSGDNSWNNGSLPTGQPYATALTAEANDGAYFIGFRYGSDTTLYTPDNISDFCSASGDSGATFTKDENGSADPADWKYILTYTPKDNQIITGVYRNLLGEINEATTIGQIASVIAEANFGNVMHDATGTQLNSSSNITGEAAKDAYSILDDTSKDTVLTKLLNGVTERDDYTIEEFSDALYWTSMLHKLINEGLTKVSGAYTSGSWSEMQTTLINAKAEYDAAGNGTDEITTAREESLCKQIQSALDQLTLKTLAVEIVTNADGVKNSVNFSATNPTLSGIVASAGQNGYAFPVYNTSVVINTVVGTEYNVEYVVDDNVMSDLVEVNEELASVTQHAQVKIIFTKKTVDIVLPDAGVEAVTADVNTNADGLQVNMNDVATLRIVPSEGQVIIPGATVKYTIGGGEHNAVVQADGTFVVNATDDVVVTDISAALKDLDKSSLTQLLNAINSKYDSNSDTLYNATDFNWTQESWENLFGGANEGGIYGGVYGEALSVAENPETTIQELQAAVEALTEASNNLKPQYEITLADGFAMQNEGQPTEKPQAGVVMIDNTWYAAKGTSVVLNVTVPEGKDLNKISYHMGTETLYAWASGGAVTIYGVSDTVNSLTMDVSDMGFSNTPTEGGIGEATGSESHGNTYILTPDEGSELVSITIDGQRAQVPDDTELVGIVTAAFAEDYSDGDVGETTIEINGRDIEFTKYNVEDTENEIPAGAVIGILPGIGKIQITTSGDTISATVITPGSHGYQAGTVITITTEETDDHQIIGTELQPDGSEYAIAFDTPADGATVTWTKQNTGSHSVTAETRLKTYSVTIAQNGEEPPTNVGGITASSTTVKYGGTSALTLPAPQDIDDIPQEVSMTSIVTFTIGGTNYSDTLAALNSGDNGISVVVKADGSATLTITDVSGNVKVTGATVDGTAKGTTQAAQGLEADKTLFTQKLTALQDAIREGNLVNGNAGNIYDETTEEWTGLTDISTGEIKEKSDLDTDLSAIDLDIINSEETLISEIEDKLGVTPGTKTFGELLSMIDTATEELVSATNNAKILADDVISIPKDTQYEGGGTNVDGLEDKGTVGTDPGNNSSEDVVNTTNGGDLVISGIKTEAGYLPIATVTVDGENGSSYEVMIRVTKDGTDFKAQIASVDSNGSIIDWTDTENVNVNGTIDATTQEGTFDITVPNEKLISVLGEDTSDPADINDYLGNITGIEIGTYSIGREMSTAKEILNSTKVGGYMGVSQVNIDTANDDTPDFMAGELQSNPNVTPLVAEGATVSVSYHYSQDVYAKGSNNWYKELYGVEIRGTTYELDNGQFPAGSGLTYIKTESSGDPLKNTGGKVIIDTNVFTDELTGIKLLCRPTNSQYTTYLNEYEEVNNSIDQLLQDTVDNIDSLTDEEMLSYLDIDDINELTESSEYYNDLYEDADNDSQTPKTPLTGSALTDALKGLARTKALSEANFSGLNAEQIESVLKQIKRLIAQTGGTYAAEPTGGVNEYYLTEENKDYLAEEIEQLKLYQRKLTALNQSEDFNDAVNDLYHEAVSHGLNLPLSVPITDEEHAIITKVEEDIRDLEEQYNTLSEYEKNLITEETQDMFNDLLEALDMSRENVLTEEEKFSARVNIIDGMITGSSPYTIDDPDLTLKRITQAYDLYDTMTEEEQVRVGVKKSLLDELKENLETYLADQAEKFAKNWLTTDYTGTSDTQGSVAYNSDTNRLDSDQDKNGYENRVSLAKNNYDELPSSIQEAIDQLFHTPTVPQLYGNTYPDYSDLMDVDIEALADKFISDYLTISGSVIIDATKDNYQNILDAERTWNKLTLKVQNEVNRKLTEDYSGKTYSNLLAPAKTMKADKEKADAAAKEFIDLYLRYDGSVIIEVTKPNKSTILDAKSPWDALDSNVQDAVDELLTDTYNGLTYIELYESAYENATMEDLAQSFINQYLRFSESVITEATKSNKSTILDAKSPWDTLDSNVQDAVDELLTDTYNGLTYDELYTLAKQIKKSSTSDTASKAGATDTSKTTDASPVVVDGISYKIGTQETTNGVTTVTPDQTKLNDKLEKAKENGTVMIPVTRDANANTGTAALNLKNIEDMAEKKITLSIQEKSVSYDLPTVDVDTKNILTELGATDPENVTVEISIADSGEKTQDAVATDVLKAGANVVVPAMEFKVTASYGGKSLEVSRFSNYVSRTVEITEEQAQKITTAIVHEANGSIRHVPTFVYQKDGKWYAEINSCTNSVYTLIYNEINFPDASGKWYEKVVNEMGSRMIIFGRENGEFEGSANITRAEFAAILIRALGLPADGNVSVFTDVQKNQWYYGAVGTAYEYGLISGKTHTAFDPMANITREEAMLMIARAAKKANFTGTYSELTGFTDAKNVSSWALEGVKFNVGSGIIVGSNGKLCPEENISRAESAAVILRLLQKAELVDVRSKS